MRFKPVLCAALLSAAAAAEAPSLETLFDQRDYQAMQAWFASRDGVESLDIDALYWKSRLVLARGEGEHAVELVDLALARAPEQARLHSLRGSALAATLGGSGRMAQLRTARQLRQSFETAVELDPDDVEGRFGLLNYYVVAPRVAGGSARRAREQADALARISPVDGALADATLRVAESDMDGALAALEQALALDPERPDARFTLGLMRVEREDWAAARQHFQTLLDQVPLHNGALYQVGRLAALSGDDLDEGRAALETFLAREHQFGTPDHAAAHWRLGMVLAAQNDPAGARAQYQRAVELDPALEEAGQMLAALEVCEDSAGTEAC